MNYQSGETVVFEGISYTVAGQGSYNDERCYWLNQNGKHSKIVSAEILEIN